MRRYITSGFGLGLKKYSSEDANFIVNLINNPELNKFFAQPLPIHLEAVKSCIARMSKSETEAGFIPCDLTTGLPVGIVEIRDIDRYSSKCKLEMSIADPKNIGKGYGSRIISLAEKYIFEDLKLRKVSFNTLAGNESMIRLGRKMGYGLEGVLKDEALKDGIYLDELVFSKIRNGAPAELSHIPQNVLGLIGNTPVVELRKINPYKTVRLFGKLEYYNPSGSVKDRAAYEMIEQAEKMGLVREGTTIIECTSGNTGIGLAMVCAVKNLKCLLTAPEGVIPLGKRKIMESFGAELILTPLEGDYELSIKRSEELAKNIENSFVPHQFDNPANPQVHQKTTAIEIMQTFGSNLDAIVSAVGSGGTITGLGRELKKYFPRINMVAVEPENCAALSKGKIGVHYILGIGAGFVPSIIDKSLIDRVITVSDEEAARSCLELSRLEGIFGGISSGAAVCGALKYCSEQKERKNVLVIIPDNGVRYVGKPGFFMDFFDEYVTNNKS